MKVKVENVRAAFMNVFKPDSKYERYGASFPIEPGSANAKRLDDAIKVLAKEKWGEKAPGILTKMKSEGALCYLAHAKTNSEGEVYDGFEDMHTLNSSNKARPLVIDRQKNVLLEEDGIPYSGCFVMAMVDLWAQDNSFGKKINATLTGVQFYAHGDAFSGAKPATPDDFDDLGEGADSGDDLT